MRFPDKTAGAHRAFSLSKSFRDLGYRVVLIGLDDKQQKTMEFFQQIGYTKVLIVILYQLRKRYLSGVIICIPLVNL